MSAGIWNPYSQPWGSTPYWGSQAHAGDMRNWAGQTAGAMSYLGGMPGGISGETGPNASGFATLSAYGLDPPDDDDRVPGGGVRRALDPRGLMEQLIPNWETT